MSDRTVVYLDSSALVKLVRREGESAALRTFLRRRPDLVSSALAITEVGRAAARFGAATRAAAEAVLRVVELVDVSDEVLRSAVTVQPPAARSLNAVHLATALSVGSTLDRLVTYDLRMAEAATQLGLRVGAPR